MSVAEQVRRIQPRIEFSALIGSCQCDEEAYDGPSQADLDWFAAQSGCDLAEPVSGILSFPEWIGVQAAYLRSLGSDAADWLAGKVDELAREVRFTGATSPQQHEERIEVMSPGAPGTGAAYSLEIVRAVAGLLDTPSSALVPDLLRAADNLERVIRTRS